jgi:predicted nucleic acid-binding Zn ribbon protein
MAQSIGAIIQEWLRANNLEEKIQQKSIPGYWVEIVGEALASHSEVERVDKGRMYIRVESATWRNEISMRREEIRRKVNEHFGAEIVQEVIVR